MGSLIVLTVIIFYKDKQQKDEYIQENQNVVQINEEKKQELI